MSFKYRLSQDTIHYLNFQIFEENKKPDSQPQNPY